MAEIPWMRLANRVDNLRFSLFMLELSLLAVATVNAAIFLRILLKTQKLHRNLKAVFCNMCFVISIVASTRYVIVPCMITGQIRWPLFFHLGFLHDCGMFALEAEQWSLALERTISALCAARYERNSYRPLAVFFFVFPWISALIGASSQYLGLIKPILYGKYIISLLCIMQFFVIHFINQRKRRRSFAGLNQRYQVVENLKSMPILYVHAAFSTCRSIVAFSIKTYLTNFYYNIDVKNEASAYHYQLISNFYDLWHTVIICILPIALIFSHSEMRARYGAMFGVLPYWRHMKDVRPEGQNYEIKAKDETDAYFQNLLLSWQKIPTVPHRKKY